MRATLALNGLNSPTVEVECGVERFMIIYDGLHIIVFERIRTYWSRKE